MDYTPTGRVGEDDFDLSPLDHINNIHISDHSFGIDSTDAMNTLQLWNTPGQSYSALHFPEQPEWLVVATELGGRISNGFFFTETPELVPPTPCSSDTSSVQDFYATDENYTLVYSEPGTGVVYSGIEDPPDVSTSIPDAPPVLANNDHDYTCVARAQIGAGVIEQNILALYDKEKSKPFYKCAVCQKRYSNRANLENHIYTKHYGIRHPWRCLTCVGLGFTSQTSARRHKKHSHIPRTTCPRCEKSYSRPDYLDGYHKKSCKGLKKGSQKRIEKALTAI